MNKTPKAEEILNKYNSFFNHEEFKEDALKAMVEFGRICARAALEAAVKNVDFTLDTYRSRQEGSTFEIDEESILTAYPESNIV